MGAWLRANGETIYGTEAGPVQPAPWGATTRKGKNVYVHVFPTDSVDTSTIFLPLMGPVKSVKTFADGKKVKHSRTRGGVTLYLDNVPDVDDYIIEIREK